jgi:uncharacterized protein YecA (UPF0149 family)
MTDNMADLTPPHDDITSEEWLAELHADVMADKTDAEKTRFMAGELTEEERAQLVKDLASLVQLYMHENADAIEEYEASGATH